jgi:hypothetical protein
MRVPRRLVLILTLAAPGVSPALAALVGDEGRAVAGMGGLAARSIDTERLVQYLRSTLVNGSIRDRVELMRGLAVLRDPALRPLFAQLADSPWLEVRMQAILAGAELEPERGIDLLAVQRLTDRREQAELIAAAVGRDLLAPGQLEDLARWQDLDPRLTVSIAGLLTTTGTPPAPQRVRAILDDATLDVELRLHAALVLIQQGDNTVQSLATDLFSRVLKQEGTRGDDAVSGVFARIRRQRLSASLPLLMLSRSELRGRPLLRFEALATMLAVACDQPAVIEETRRELDFKGETPADRQGHRVRVALAMLEPAVTSPRAITPAYLDLLKDDTDPMISAIRGVLVAAANGKELGAAAAELARQRHVGALNWTLRLAKQCAWQDAMQIRLAVVEQSWASANATVVQTGIQAASGVFDSDPAPLRSRLEAALRAGETPLVSMLLAGALRSSNREATSVLSLVGPQGGAAAWPDRSTGALADLVAARHAAADGAVRVPAERLEKIAYGDGDLPTPMRLQAAWLAIKAHGQERLALAKLMAGSVAASPPTP